jgi:predicted nucleic acid-binding protein
MDLLIASIALHHNAVVLTFDADFQKLGVATGVQVKLLMRRVP